MDKINNSLIPEAKEQFREGKLRKSAAYETSRLPAEEQREVVAAMNSGEDIKHKEIAERVREKKESKAAEKASERAEKAAKRAEQAQTAAAQAGLQAERAAENAEMSATGFSDTAMNLPETWEEKQEWSTREWTIYTLDELMRVANYITDDDLILLQDVLIGAKERSEKEGNRDDKNQLGDARKLQSM